VDEVSVWYCCLNTRELTVLRRMAEALALVLWAGVPTEVWDGIWLSVLAPVPAYKEAFLSIYCLEIVTIGTEEEAAVVVRPTEGNVTLWASWGVFILTPGAACLDGCGLSTV